MTKSKGRPELNLFNNPEVMKTFVDIAKAQYVSISDKVGYSKSRKKGGFKGEFFHGFDLSGVTRSEVEAISGRTYFDGVFKQWLNAGYIKHVNEYIKKKLALYWIDFDWLIGVIIGKIKRDRVKIIRRVKASFKSHKRLAQELNTLDDFFARWSHNEVDLNQLNLKVNSMNLTERNIIELELWFKLCNWYVLEDSDSTLADFIDSYILEFEKRSLISDTDSKEARKEMKEMPNIAKLVIYFKNKNKVLAPISGTILLPFNQIQ